ncbi:helix-turn-helix domain-containing protein [Methanocella sp. CWC-04]|uniref:Helix-turn-helix domain-containing protein n=1 Tax=Methanooceanicella nereidis TaxID=2052831 RepID=A0AAP2RE63_9EURY|nr:helix-turn-helix domain-containing protein [Methanocella sp. CWC-04]MCD1296026.1 helix-turn-helix domain-containing protein [Methanocella sp. CWC-04]
MVVSIGIKHKDCWHYKLSRSLKATIIVKYTYVLPNKQLYGYQTIITPRINELEGFLSGLPEIKKFTVLSKCSNRAEVITWAQQSSIIENIIKTNCVFVGPTVVKDGIENWHLMAPTRKDLQTVMSSLEDYADIAYIRNNDGETVPDGAGLTGKQMAALTTALDMGYFDSPRRASIEDVAQKMGISPSTAVEHLRKAEKKVLENYVHPK